MHYARTLGVITVAALAACTSDSINSPTGAREDAANAVTLFTQLADSVSRSGGDSAIGGAYASLAEAVRQGGRISTISITVDGVPTRFSATALHTEITTAPCNADVCAAVVRTVTLRSLVAWQQDDPRRIVQLSSSSDADPIRAYLYPVLVPFPGASATLTYFDGKGGAFFGTSGSQKVAVTKGSEACVTAGADRPIIAIYPAPPKCTKADFVVSFSAKAEPSTFLGSRSTATGSHTFDMPSQGVLGSVFEMVALDPPKPPIDFPTSTPLPATLTISADSVVTLTLTISNPSATPATIVHSSSQEFDFVIVDASTGKAAYRWSADKGFFQAITSGTLAANGRLSYSITWRPPTKGAFIATGELVSISHRASAKGTFTVN